MSKELLLIDLNASGQTDRYGVLLSASGGNIVRAADGVLVPLSAANHRLAGIALSDADAAYHYAGDAPANMPTGVYRRIYKRKVGATFELDDPAIQEDIALDWNGAAGLPVGATVRPTRTTLVRSWVVDGSPANVTSIVLADPTNAYGVRRTDTNAVVVPAGTAMANTGVGVYSYAFDDPATNLVYQYWEKVTDVDGVVYYFEKQRSGPASLPSRSYLLSGDADQLANLLPRNLLPAWFAASATDDAKGRALEQASYEVDAAGPWQGRKWVPDAAGYPTGTTRQLRQFPRVAYETLPGAFPFGGARGLADVVWDWDDTLQAAVVPYDVKVATLYQADSILAGTRAQQLAAQQAGLASQSVGGISESYRAGAGAGPSRGLQLLCLPAAALMEKYQLKTGRLL